VPTVLVSDHEPEVAEMARRYLERASMRALVTCAPAQTLGALATGSADLYVIDLTMPGLQVRGVRQALGAGVPVVFLLDRGDPRPHGLNSPPSVRRWLTRPFSPRALVVAVADLLHPVPAQSRPADPAGVADRRRHDIVLDGRDISLTRTEFVLVSALAQQPGRVLTRQRLLAALENERGKRPSPRAVDVYIGQLRAKLGADTIKTVHGVGYVLDLSGPGPQAPAGPPAEQSAGQRQGMAYALLRQTQGGSPRRDSGEG
jgi:two-component system, OmpR family, response regulator